MSRHETIERAREDTLHVSVSCGRYACTVNVIASPHNKYEDETGKGCKKRRGSNAVTETGGAAGTALPLLLFSAAFLPPDLGDASALYLRKQLDVLVRKRLGCLEEASSALGRKYKKAEDAWEGRPLSLDESGSAAMPASYRAREARVMPACARSPQGGCGHRREQ